MSSFATNLLRIHTLRSSFYCPPWTASVPFVGHYMVTEYDSRKQAGGATRATVRLTKRAIDQAKPLPKPYFVWDGELKGFGGAHRPRRRKNVRGSRSAKRPRGVCAQTLHTIGRYGALTVDKARNRAKEILGAVATGGTPPPILHSGARRPRSRKSPTSSSGSMSDRSERCRRRRTINRCLQPTRSPLWETARPRR